MLVGVLAVTAAGCFTSAGGDECRIDSDCGGLTCTRVGACAAETRTMRIEWTVQGLTTDQPGACVGVSELDVTVSDPTTGETFTVRPVPCAVGSFFFDKLPLGFTEATVSAYGSSGAALDTERGVVSSDGVVRLSLLR